MNLISNVKAEFDRNLEQEGLFWRLAQLDTFRDLLILHAGKNVSSASDSEVITNVIVIVLKALINEKLGVKAYSSDYKRLNKELFVEQDLIRNEADRILSRALLELTSSNTAFPLDEGLNYFDTLHKLEISTPTIAFFEKALITFLSAATKASL